jgi:acyl-CoA synthetase (AMP-forming)/AMP-acid ligase II
MRLKAMISDYIQCNEANYQTLSPVTMIERSALAFPDRVAIYYGDITYTWLDYYSRCKHLAAALKQLGIGKGDVVSVMSPNTLTIDSMLRLLPLYLNTVKQKFYLLIVNLVA